MSNKPMRRTIQRAKVQNLINTTCGRLFSVRFTKKDNTDRKMTARLGVHKGLKGGVSTTANKQHLVTVYDMHALGFRTINLNTIYQIKVNGKSYDVI